MKAQSIVERFVYELLDDGVKPAFEKLMGHFRGNPVSVIIEGVSDYSDVLTKSSKNMPEYDPNITCVSSVQTGLILGFMLGSMKEDQRVKFFAQTSLEEASQMASSINEKMQ